MSQVRVGKTIENILLYHVLFWIQIHGLSVGFMLETIGKHLGKVIGDFLKYDVKNNFVLWKTFMCIHVLVDV